MKLDFIVMGLILSKKITKYKLSFSQTISANAEGE
jgi:hypothetical protein